MAIKMDTMLIEEGIVELGIVTLFLTTTPALKFNPHLGKLKNWTKKNIEKNEYYRGFKTTKEVIDRAIIMLQELKERVNKYDKENRN